MDLTLADADAGAIANAAKAAATTARTVILFIGPSWVWCMTSPA
jgi:hypothetical protein